MSIFTGCGTAIVTPFRQNLSLDESALRKLIRRQIDAGIDYLVPCGTTGESPTHGKEWRLSLHTPVIVKYRDGKTDARVQLEELLR